MKRHQTRCYWGALFYLWGAQLPLFGFPHESWWDWVCNIVLSAMFLFMATALMRFYFDQKVTDEP